jgi:DNA-binding NarL/FixJ family response regulator
MALRVVLVDDHPIVLDGLAQLFGLEPGFEVVGRCRDGREALEAVRETPADLLVLDVRMPDLGGLDVARLVGDLPRAPRILLLAATLEDHQLAEALRLGVGGIVLKEVASERLLEAAREVCAGRRYLDPVTLGRVLRVERHRSPPGAAVLTPRETEVVRLVARGLRNRAIADQLSISEGTVKIHLHNIYEKLAVDGRLALLVEAQRLDLR